MINIKNLSYYHQEAQKSPEPFFTNLNLSIKKGECVLLAGKSGSGKSTILKILNGIATEFYNSKIAGSVRVDDLDALNVEIYKLSEKVGSVFQHPKTQFYTTNTRDEIAFALENYGLASTIINERIEKSAASLEITPLLDRNIFQLSGGEKQKIAIASVYAMQNDIFLFDEPSSSLDIDSMKNLATIMKTLKQEGKTIIIAEHRLWYLKDIVDRLIYLEKGKIKLDAPILKINHLTLAQRLQTGLRTLEKPKIDVTNEEEKGSAEDILKITNLSYKEHQKMIFHLPHLILKAKHITGFIGKNGIGKSTFLKIIAGLLREKEGTIKEDGKKLSLKKRLQDALFIMQEVNQQLFTDSLYEEIALTSSEKDTKEIEKALKSMQLEHLVTRHPHTLSGGEKQKLIVLAALLTKKKILIFDEPTSGLDYNSMHIVYQNIKKYQKNHKYIFIVSHDFEFLNLVADTVVDLDKHFTRNLY